MEKVNISRESFLAVPEVARAKGAADKKAQKSERAKDDQDLAE